MCEHYGISLPEDHRHFIASEVHHNCVLCLVEAEGPMTQERIGQYLGVTKEWISQIEKAALKKLRATLGPDALQDLLNEPVPAFTPKTVLLQGRCNITKYLDVFTKFSTEDGPAPPYNWRNRVCRAT